MARNDFQSNYLAHHGILGMKWGIRRYQNDDGSLTAAGRERYGVKEGGSVNDISSAKGIKRRLNDVDKAIARNKYHRGKALAKVNSKSLKSSNTKNATKAEKHSEMIRKGEQETERLLSKAEKMGYSVKSSSTVRNVSSGKEIIARTLLGSALATGMLLPFGRIAFVPGKPSLVGGKKYNVKESKETTSVEKELSEDKAKKQAENSVVKEKKSSSQSLNTWEQEYKKGGERAKELVTDETISSNKKSMAKSIAKSMADDMKRWNKEDGYTPHSSLRNKSESEIESILAKNVEKSLTNYNKEHMFAFNDGIVSIPIDGIPMYSDNQPLTIEFDPKTKKVKNFYYT